MRKQWNQFWRLQDAQRRERPFLFWVRVAALCSLSAFIILQRNFWTPDTLFIVLLALFIVFGQARAFFVRFFPFVALLLVYDFSRGIADDLNKTVHFTEMIDADRLMFFGALPTSWLQNIWWHGAVQWYDFYFYFLYTIHFLAPVLLAVLIWKVRGKLYWPYVTALVMLSFSAFITYIVFPAAPPWMASDLGYIEPIHRISSDIWYAMGVTNFSEIYANIPANPVAAVPSLHSAYPLLFVLFLVKLFGLRRMWWAYIYPVSIWIGVVYLGEHYVIDAILGALYAIAAYYAAFAYFVWRSKQEYSFGDYYQQGYAWGYAVAQKMYGRRPSNQ